MSHIERIVFYTLHCPAAWATSRSYTTVPPAPSKAPNTSQVHLKYSWMSRRDQVALSHPALWNHRLLPKAWLYILICLRSSVSLPARLRSPGGGGGVRVGTPPCQTLWPCVTVHTIRIFPPALRLCFLLHPKQTHILHLTSQDKVPCLTTFTDGLAKKGERSQ